MNRYSVLINRVMILDFVINAIPAWLIMGYLIYGCCKLEFDRRYKI